MKSLFPIYDDSNKNFMLHQTVWSQILNKFFSNPLVTEPVTLKLPLVSGDNVINHLLGRPIVGCIVILQDAASSFYEKETGSPSLTFILNASAPCNVSLYVF